MLHLPGMAGDGTDWHRAWTPESLADTMTRQPCQRMNKNKFKRWQVKREQGKFISVVLQHAMMYYKDGVLEELQT